ncbi:hypothetical protein LCGC14_2640870, partial [marine sediment metagenome]
MPNTIVIELPIAEDALTRFWSRVKILKNGCWGWAGYLCGNGYGYIKINKRKIRAHRFAYTQLVGEIPEGLTIDHLCRNRGCVNPSHLEVTTIGENVLR